MTEALTLNNFEMEGSSLALKALLAEMDGLARRWGGADYRNGVIDGVDVARGVRLRGQDSSTTIKFNADRVRADEFSEKLYTAYTLRIEVSRDIEAEELPSHAYQTALTDYEPTELLDPNLSKEEKHTVIFRIDDDDEDLSQEIEISYFVDKEEILSISSEDGIHGDESDNDEADEPQESLDMLPQQVPAADAESADAQDTEGVSAESALLNDAWQLIGNEKGTGSDEEPIFDPDLLVKMARMHRRLEKEDAKLWRLLSLARSELMEMQIQQCRNILKKLRPGAAL